MQRRAVGRRRRNLRGRVQLTKIIPYTLNPTIPGVFDTKEETRKRIAHGQASAPASILAALLDEPGSERLMRSATPLIGCPREPGWFEIR
jgi:hypothetical protein